MLKCPGCHASAIHRSRRRHVLERLASAFGFWPYRCDNCDRRFWRFARDPFALVGHRG